MNVRRGLIASFLTALLSLFVHGCMTGGAAPSDELYFGETADCSLPGGSTDSPTGYVCVTDCAKDCGFNPRSTVFPRARKYCECEGGVYIECRCPRPDWYQGADFAPYCDEFTVDGSGLTKNVGCPDLQLCSDNTRWPCDVEWQQCVGRNPTTGNTPRGCVCMNRGPNEPMTWECGSTEKWFAPEQ